MKASDSTNSLSELNPPEKSCFICLGTDGDTSVEEPLVDSQLLRNCGCRFSVHPACWNEWMKGKSDYDCPICRKDSMLRIKIPPNPSMSVVYRHEEEPQGTRLSTWVKLGIFLIITALALTVLVAMTKKGE